MKSVLVANRGEIAVRVFRTCRRLGLRTIAIHSAEDADALHVRAADEAVLVPGYLDADAVVAAAKESGASAIHPGYGFLSENAAFARAVADAGIVWVGPPPEAMEAMARKDHAREIAVAAGVPVVPRGVSTGSTTEMVFPVLVKAAAGGGGKGMRIVRAESELAEAQAAAAREALSAFGDDTLLVEKYVERGRHIEVQVFGDAHGNVIHLGDRDCSVQRRHQKVVEEAPAPTLTPAQHELVTSSAVALARQVGYTNAGTVEFLLDEATGEAYFLEMNTRLQVEHPVTEEVTGLDLVELQLRVAAGEPLGLTQDDVTLTGHAIEARIYAEDPYAGFLPQAGHVRAFRTPAGDGVRVDDGVSGGRTVSTSYDPMIAKVVASGPDRETARARLVRALDETVVLGLQTNTGFVRELVASEEFRDAAIDTAWLDRTPLAAPDPADARQLAARALFARQRDAAGPFHPDGFRLGGPPAPVVLRLDEDVTLTHEPVDGAVDVHGSTVEVVVRGQRFVFHEPDPFDRTHGAAGDGTITSPMPGTVLDVRVAEGEAVEEGQVLGMVEAMKMELALRAPFAGTVSHVGAKAGQQVALGAELFVVTAGDE